MNALVAVAGCVLMALLAIVLPRRVAGRFRLTALFYRMTWRPWRGVGAALRNKKHRETFLSVYGPLSLLVLLAFWAGAVIFSFALLRWAGSVDLAADGARVSFGTEMYISGITFVGLEEALPRDALSRALTVWEALGGFALLAMVIGYLPVLYQSFSRREANITLLDARAGSPPSASEMMRRYGRLEQAQNLSDLLHEWEHWAAELLESHLSYPVLGFFRSQHDNQSWLGSLTAILDTCALIMVGVEGLPAFQAELTFAMARHAIVDLAKVFNVPPIMQCCERLPAESLQKLRESLASESVHLRADGEADRRLAELRRMYEPYVDALSRRLLMDLPPWIGSNKHNWTTSKWERSAGAVTLH